MSGIFRINFDSEELIKISDLKKKYGIKATTELVRFLINNAWINSKKPITGEKE